MHPAPVPTTLPNTRLRHAQPQLHSLQQHAASKRAPAQQDLRPGRHGVFGVLQAQQPDEPQTEAAQYVLPQQVRKLLAELYTHEEVQAGFCYDRRIPQRSRHQEISFQV